MNMYMVRHKTSGKFWSGQTYSSKWGETGRQWKKKKGVEDFIGVFLRYQSRYNSKVAADISNWEIVEVDVTPNVQSVEAIDDLVRHLKIRTKLEETSRNFSSFMSAMRDKGVEEKIEFIMDLEPTAGMYWVDRERIKEARAQIRGMGIKTRTFREYRGMFGFVDRQQAMQARLVLNVKKVADVAKIRDEVDGKA